MAKFTDIPKDVLGVILNFIRPPLFTSKDYNSFSRLNRVTLNITKPLKIEKATLFNIDLLLWEHKKLKNEAKRNIEDIQNHKQQKIVKGYEKLWKKIRSSLDKVVVGRKTHRMICMNFPSEGQLNNTMNSFMVPKIKEYNSNKISFNYNPYSYWKVSNGSFIQDNQGKSLNKKQFTMLIDRYSLKQTTVTSKSTYVLCIFIYDELEFSKYILDKIVKHAKKRNGSRFYFDSKTRFIAEEAFSFVDVGLKQYLKISYC